LVELRISTSITYGKDERSFSCLVTHFFKDLLDALGLLQTPFEANERDLVLPPIIDDTTFTPLRNWLNISDGHNTLSSKGLIVKTATSKQLFGVYGVFGEYMVGYVNASTANSPSMVLRNIAAQCIQNVHMDLFVDSQLLRWKKN
jgi:hypothetical protein